MSGVSCQEASTLPAPDGVSGHRQSVKAVKLVLSQGDCSWGEKAGKRPAFIAGGGPPAQDVQPLLLRASLSTFWEASETFEDLQLFETEVSGHSRAMDQVSDKQILAPGTPQLAQLCA